MHLSQSTSRATCHRRHRLSHAIITPLVAISSHAPHPFTASQHVAVFADTTAHLASGRAGCGRRRRTRQRVIARGLDEPGADGIVFGKPQAPKELYDKIAQDARAGFMKEVQGLDTPSSSGDVVRAALYLASEDDAVKTRTHIPLPTDAFSARLDTVASEARAMMPAGLSDQGQLDYVLKHLYSVWGLKVAKSMEDGLFSPYRVYMHQVLAQRCGTQAACACVLHSLLARLHAMGAVTWTAKVGLPASPSEPPVAVLSSAFDSLDATRQVDTRWVCGRELVAEQLEQLKRAYWSWDWPLGAASGFDACARGLLGESGRAGRVNAAVGVMQARGRPFGNVELALLASERLCLVTRLIPGADRNYQMQIRDYATQLLHVGRTQDGVALLEQHIQWVKQDTTRSGTTSEVQLSVLEALVLNEKRRMLQETLTNSSQAKELSILDPDRDA